ncbi:MAG: IS200/IS605 family element transposase accessory protein TnpB [Lachnospiraceae bacterium]|nr:IS200/IS605 family element transposase accessory protein TnpB [Lachnospiraceae bacterium]
MKRGLVFQIYPNKEQEMLIKRTFGCCRLIYNKGLSYRAESYKNGIKIGYDGTARMLTDLKTQDEYAFLKEVDAVALQQSLRDLDNAFRRFFQKKAKYPRFKSKKNRHQSYRTINNNNSIRIVENHIQLPKLGWVKLKQTREVGQIKNVTIKNTPSGKYFVCLNVDFVPKKHYENEGEIGIDMGICNFLTDNNGNTVDNPKYLEKSLEKLAREQRNLSRKQPGSKNFEKQRLKIALLHEKIVNQRRDFQQKQSTALVRENQLICTEDLAVKKMKRNRNYSKGIASASWAKFLAMLEYKAVWYGNKYIKVPQTFPSSQLCSGCGFKNQAVKDSRIREWTCPSCGMHHDRDKNAAINILRKGKEMLEKA